VPTGERAVAAPAGRPDDVDDHCVGHSGPLRMVVESGTDPVLVVAGRCDRPN
jgi:hypothetical protein